MVATIENKERPLGEIDADSAVNPTLPPTGSYWTPNDESAGERIKLRLLHSVSECAGWLRPVIGRSAKSSVSVLTYHRISPEFDGVPVPTINVTPEKFRQQMLGLRKAGYHFASMSTVLDACDGDATSKELPERTIVITFDDIYDNVFYNAWPILQELNIPVTLFVSAAFIDTVQPFLFDPWAQKYRYRHQVPMDAWRPITDANLRTMLESGMAELGAHTDTHQDFRNRPQAFAADLAIGVQKLQQRYGAETLPFAFPYGSPRMGFTSEPLMDIVKGLGLRCGLTTGSQTNRIDSSPFGWGRFHVFQHDTPRSLAAKIDGWYEWLPKIKNLLTRARKSSARVE